MKTAAKGRCGEVVSGWVAPSDATSLTVRRPCVYCGHRSTIGICRAHKDLLSLDPHFIAGQNRAAAPLLRERAAAPTERG